MMQEATRGKTSSATTGSTCTPATAHLDIDEMAAVLNVGERFVRRLVEQRRIPFPKIGKFVRFHPDDLEAWIAEQRVGQVGQRR